MAKHFSHDSSGTTQPFIEARIADSPSAQPQYKGENVLPIRIFVPSSTQSADVNSKRDTYQLALKVSSWQVQFDRGTCQPESDTINKSKLLTSVGPVVGLGASDCPSPKSADFCDCISRQVVGHSLVA
jgi:hypothetical protein